MNAINHAMNRVFDLVLAPLRFAGPEVALILISGIFGILALIVFKHISSQKGIKHAKNRIKAHLIEIRIYQDDLALVSKAIGKVLLRNLQYLAYNFGPFVPLSIPFVFVLAQLVVRNAFDAIPVRGADEAVLSGRGTMIEFDLVPEQAGRIRELAVHYPDGVRELSPLVRVPAEGRAFQEVVATRPGRHVIEFSLGSGARETKLLVAGVAEESMQPERGRGFFSTLLWPAEDSFAKGSPFERVHFTYPDSELGWLPGGTGGVLLVFLVASMAFGALVMKPLGVQI